jgi:hypothetical protein
MILAWFLDFFDHLNIRTTTEVGEDEVCKGYRELDSICLDGYNR